MREQEARGHDPAMTQGTWQKEHGFEPDLGFEPESESCLLLLGSELQVFHL